MAVTALGELLIDFTSFAGEDKDIPIFSANPGGAPANVLAAIKKFGESASFIGMVGDDEFGKYLKNYLEKIGINIDGLVFTKKAGTTIAFVHLGDEGERSFSFYRNPGADELLEIKDINLSCIDNCEIFHFGSLSLTRNPSRDTTFYAVNYAKEKGKIISYDPNYRPLLWESDEKAFKWMKKGAEISDIIKISEEELPLITGETNINLAADYLLNMGISLVLISKGSRGAFFATKKVRGEVSPYKVKAIDTTGAGDGFLGACLYKLKNKSLEDIKNLSNQELTDIVRFANAGGALVTTKTGAIKAMPTEMEINSLQQ